MTDPPVYEGLGPGENQKRCPGCKQSKPVSQFGKNSRSKDGLQSRCKACRNADASSVRQARPEHVKKIDRRSQLKRFNLTLEEYEDLLARQDGVCAICLRKPRKGGRRFSVDHDHSCCPPGSSCGKCVRGLLCGECNFKLLGLICREGTKGTEYAIETLRRAIDYLQRELPQ